MVSAIRTNCALEKHGAVFGIFQNFNLIFTILAIVVTLGIIYFFPRITKEEWPLRIALAMQMGGAVGNLMDQVTQGYVTDFVSLGRFAVFNVADGSISMGVVVLVIGVWWYERHHSSESSSESQSTPVETAKMDDVQPEENQPIE